MVSVLVFGSPCPGSSPGWGHCVVFLRGKSLFLAVPLLTQGWVVRKLFNANPGLNVNRSINFSGIKRFFFFYCLRFVKFELSQAQN